MQLCFPKNVDDCLLALFVTFPNNDLNTACAKYWKEVNRNRDTTTGMIGMDGHWRLHIKDDMIMVEPVNNIDCLYRYGTFTYSRYDLNKNSREQVN